MLEELYRLAVDEGGIWCCLCIYLIIHQQKKQNALEKWVKDEVIVSINASTKVMTEIKEHIDVHQDRRHNRDS